MDRDDFTRTARAPAKLNLFLEILGRRADGFHDLETVMVPIRLADQVTFRTCEGIGKDEPGQIELDIRTCWPVRSRLADQTVPAGSKNIVVKALELFRERSGCVLGARVDLVKRIPMGAGLGGGSSDAAAALRLANRGWGINWSNERLADLAAELGSDIPFFLSIGAAICRGRGEKIERIAPRRPLHFVLVKPPVHLNTADVYGAYDSQTNLQRDRTNKTTAGKLSFACSDVRNWMHNRLQSAASLLSPWVDKIRDIFAEFDFAAHQLTGSGSAYFGVCRHAQHARRLANILRMRQLGLVYATRSCP
jgi:4-diphosphocytidyl-2-C-methyl-D-erythritol kinase